MKAILISIKPKWVAKILNGEKTIEIRKTMPKCDLPINVYIYCTKDKKHKLEYCDINKGCWSANDGGDYYNGKVVAKFTLNKVEEIFLNKNHFVNEQYSTNELGWEELLEQSCLTYRELDDYLQCEIGYAIYISDLEIFDKPKELSDFRKLGKKCKYQGRDTYCDYCSYCDCIGDELIKAPQSWCYVEVNENE